MLVEIKIGTTNVLAVLYPTGDPDVWHLGSAYGRRKPASANRTRKA
jgi:hypothetical protein